jgi:hypothetical protein
MNLKISVDKPSHYRAPRKVVRESKAMEYAPAASPHSASLANYASVRKIEALKRQQVHRVPKPKLPPPPPPPPAEPQPGFLSRAFSFLRAGSAPTKQLRLVETISLGEKRFAAILYADGRRFLVGGGTAGVSLLAPLDETPDSLEDVESLQELSELSE